MEEVRWGKTFWEDINPDFGVWHKPNARHRAVKQCFDVIYSSNSSGARDIERRKTAQQPRVIVLGDSMMEGFGVADGKRVSDLLEARTGIEHMNFATSGVFSPTQYYLVYKTIAKQFAHSVVLIGLLPANDLLEDDIGYGKTALSDRYRPYFVSQGSDYELTYFQDSLTKSSFRQPDDRLALVKRTLGEFTYTYNALTYAKAAWTSRRGSTPTRPEYPQSPDRSRYSGYFDYTAEQLAHLEFVLLRIRDEANGRPVVVAILPTRIDFERSMAEGPPALTAALREFGEKEGIEIVDLLPTMNAQGVALDELFLPCDGHWSEQGHRAAANAILSAISIYRKGLSSGHSTK
jgi:hypothetical protein